MSRAYARRQNDGIAPQTTENETLPAAGAAFRFRWSGFCKVIKALSRKGRGLGEG